MKVCDKLRQLEIHTSTIHYLFRCSCQHGLVKITNQEIKVYLKEKNVETVSLSINVSFLFAVARKPSAGGEQNLRATMRKHTVSLF